MTDDKPDSEHNQETQPSSPANKDKEIKTLHHFYAAFSVSILLGFVPSVAIQTLSVILFMGVFIAAYIIRSKSDAQSLLWNHMSYNITTIWIGGLFTTIAICIAGTWFYQIGDHSLISLYMEQIQLGMENGYTDTYQIENLANDYISENKKSLVSITITCVVPCICYFVYRIAKGLTHGLKGYRLQDVKGWF